MSLPTIIAHRGASGHAPENTLAAFAKAAELGAQWVEFDCMLAGDDTIVIHHDESLLRITGAELMIAESSVSKIKALDAGSWYGEEFHHEKVPTLAETLDILVAVRLGANIEIKPSKGTDRETGKAIAEQVIKRWPSHIPAPVISSFSEEALMESLKILPDVEHAILWEGVPDDWRDALQRIGATAIHCEGKLLSEDQVRAIKADGLPLRCYTVNDVELGRRLLSWGVDALITDFPERFLELTAGR